MPSVEDAQAFISQSRFIWHQRFELAPGIFTPGVNDIGWLMNRAGIPFDLFGKSVLDIGANNGGMCFEAERRGAERVVAVDLATPEWFGFQALSDFLESRVEYKQASVYELPSILTGQFDVVLFFGVLYHLRHPLLALDVLRILTGSVAYIETAVVDYQFLWAPGEPIARFARRDEVANDGSNWFYPTRRCLVDWLASCGFVVEHEDCWPENRPERALAVARPSGGDPEYLSVSYEKPLVVKSN